MNKIEFEICNFNNSDHKKAFAELLNHYMADPMGDYEPHDINKQNELIEKLSNHPTVFIIFVKYNNQFAGMATCFELFSTFKIKPYMYIHDVVIHSNFRGKGLGKALLERIIEESEIRDYCKLTLEVREDNTSAMALYKNLGFIECEPNMYFWTKTLH